MRRWNGWGAAQTDYPLPPAAGEFLRQRVPPGDRTPDAELDHVLASIPPSRLAPHPLIKTEALPRLLHARGQSLPDWLALRSGRIGVFPDGVAYPQTRANLRRLLDYAAETGVALIPYGGGTSVVGHINPLPGAAPVLTVDMGAFNRLEHLDATSRLATIGAGARGPEIEAMLNARGYTLGHFPQSFELSTLGGWIAARSTGQQSYYYGRIEDLFAGGWVETPRGPLELPPLPASAAGPDLRQLVLGSEGRLGFITHAQVRISPLPARENFYGVFFRDWESGAAALRAAAQAGLGLSMLRLSNATETETTLALSGKDNLVTWANRGLGALGYGPERCLLIYGLTGAPAAGEPAAVAAAQSQMRALLHAHGGLVTGETVGRQWRKSRFHTPYLRNTLWQAGYALDTLETALPWRKAPAAAVVLQRALYLAAQQRGQPVFVFAHLSHVYRDGASLYVTYLFPRAADPDQTLDLWQALKSAASQEIVRLRGTISHQHGVGLDHAPYLAAEKGPLGLHVLAEALGALDPLGLLNPGKLLPENSLSFPQEAANEA